jgi:hypothetical protein
MSDTGATHFYIDGVVVATHQSAGWSNVNAHGPKWEITSLTGTLSKTLWLDYFYAEIPFTR